jgi:hypothetical protein
MEIPRVNLTAPKDGENFYTDDTGHEYARMTHILDKCIPKPALKFWAEKVGRESMFAVTAQDALGIIKGQEHNRPLKGDVSIEDYVDALKADGLDTKSLSEVAMARGTRIHAHLEEMRHDSTPIAVPEDERPELDGYLEQAKAFMEAYKPEFHATEFMVAHEGLGYAGTVDALATIKAQPGRRNKGYDLTGQTVLIDYKTNKAGKVYSPTHAYQLNGYLAAYLSRIGSHSHEAPPYPTHGLVVAIGESSYATKVVEYEPVLIENLLAFYRDLVG